MNLGLKNNFCGINNILNVSRGAKMTNENFNFPFFPKKKYSNIENTYSEKNNIMKSIKANANRLQEKQTKFNGNNSSFTASGNYDNFDTFTRSTQSNNNSNFEEEESVTDWYKNADTMKLYKDESSNSFYGDANSNDTYESNYSRSVWCGGFKWNEDPLLYQLEDGRTGYFEPDGRFHETNPEDTKAEVSWWKKL